MMKIGAVYKLDGSPFRYMGTDGTWVFLKEIPDGTVRRYLASEVTELPLWHEVKDATKR